MADGPLTGGALDSQAILQDLVELAVEQAEVGVCALRGIPTVVPVVGEGAGEEVAEGTDARVRGELGVERPEEVREGTEGGRGGAVAAVDPRPERVEEGAGEDQQVELPLCSKWRTRRGWQLPRSRQVVSRAWAVSLPRRSRRTALLA